MILSLEETFTVGQNCFFDSVSNDDRYGVVFEDDTTTGYFYAVDMLDEEQQILDALHIYNVDDVIDKAKPGKIQIAWSKNGSTALLLINGYLHAAFDFEKQTGCCRNGFPDSHTGWGKGEERILTDNKVDSLVK